MTIRRTLLAFVAGALLAGAFIEAHPHGLFAGHEAAAGSHGQAHLIPAVWHARGARDVKKAEKEREPRAVVPLDASWRALPLDGPFRFAPPEGAKLADLERGAHGGWLDWFGNEWVPHADAARRVDGWSEYLTFTGRLRLRGTLKSAGVTGIGAPVFVTLDGEHLRARR